MIARLHGVLTSASALGYQVILAGDLNGVFDPLYDRIPGGLSRSSDTALMHLLTRQDLTDVFHMLYPDEHSLQAMTRINPADPLTGSRIDYILASPELALCATHSQVVPVLGLVSDRHMLFTSFSLGMLTKCVRHSSVRKYMKAQSSWNFSAMTQESWAMFSQAAEGLVISLVPKADWDQLEVSLQDMSLDSIWEIFIQVLKSAAEKAIPQQQVGGEPWPPKKEVPLNHGI